MAKFGSRGYSSESGISTGAADRAGGLGGREGRDRNKREVQSERARQRMASTLSGVGAGLLGANPIGQAVASGVGGYAAGQKPAESILGTLGTGAGWMLGGPIGGFLLGQGGKWLVRNLPDATPGVPGQRPQMMARRDRGGNQPILPFPQRQGMIGALI